jgi:dienelactone hydrolase
MNRLVSAFLGVCALGICMLPANPMLAQATGSIVEPLLKQHLQSHLAVTDELRNFMLRRVPPLTLPSNAKQWDKEAGKIRAHELSVIYHGWPQAWLDSAPKFEKVGVVEGHGYRIVKLRYEIVPGFESVALLYEPEHMTGKMPAILDVNGHGAGGKAVEHKQKRCINQARRGIIALSPEFIGYGELSSPGSAHNNIGLLDLSGHNGLGLFYLAMRRGLDYLYNDPNVDRSRIGVTGISGGGFQTIVLSALDTRVGPAVPVAGFSTLTTAIEHPEYLDAEQNASDFRQNADYAQLVAIRAPRPTLLIYNSMDDCCFRADIVKQGVYLDMKPFYALYGKPENLQWHQNLIPGTHNYGLDNRQVAYQFFDNAFHLNVSAQEYPDTDAEVLPYAETLVGGLPKDNLTILSLAQSFAKQIHHEVPADHDAQWQQSQRQLLKQVVRYAPVTLTHAWPIAATHQQDVESMGYRFEFSNGLSATGVFFRAASAPEDAPAVVLIADAGMPSVMVDVTNWINRGRRVLVLDPLFFGENVPNPATDTDQYEQLLNGIGERTLGLEAAQVNALVPWLTANLQHGSATPRSPALQPSAHIAPVQILTSGVRSQTVASVAVALEPQLFSSFDARGSIPSMAYAFDHPLTYIEAPELMCLDLYKDFDFNTLTAMAAPVKVDLNAKMGVPMFWD